MFRFRGAAPALKPEGALKRAEELLGVGQKQNALQTLHDTITNKRHQRNWNKAFEQAMLKYVDICVDMKAGRKCKDALINYRNACQQVNVGSLEEVIKYLLQVASARAEEASKAAAAQLDAVEDLEAEASPEEMMLSYVSGEKSKDRTDREVVTPWFKFLWETYRNVLDILRNNSRLEALYAMVAARACQFCLTYKRTTEFRRLCDIVRNHLSNLLKYRDQGGRDRTDLNVPATWELYVEMRFTQLRTACDLELWAEAFRSVEDIQGLFLLAPKGCKPKAGLMATYYAKLTQIFTKSESRLYSAYAWYRLFTFTRINNKSLGGADLAMMASNVVLSALSILPYDQAARHDADPAAAAERATKMAAILGFNVERRDGRSLLSRDALIADIEKKGLLLLVPAEVKQLFSLLESDFNPLQLCKVVAPLLEQLNALNQPVTGASPVQDMPLEAYSVPLQRVAVAKMVRQLSEVYSVMRVSHMSELAPFIGFGQAEQMIVDAVRSGYFQARFDHKNNTVHFGGQEVESERVRGHIATMAKRLTRALAMINPARAEDKEARRARLVALALQSAEGENERMLRRKHEIEKRKEEAERQAMERERELEEQRQAAEQLAREQEERRKEQERARREAERIQRELEEREQEELKAYMASRGKKVGEGEKLDAKAINKEVLSEQLKQQQELQRKLAKLGKQMDHLERARREEEAPLLAGAHEAKLTQRLCLAQGRTPTPHMERVARLAAHFVPPPEHGGTESDRLERQLTLAGLGTTPEFEQAQNMTVFPPAKHDALGLEELLTPEEREIRDRVRRFAETEIAPVIADYWERAEFPFPLVPGFQKLGIGGGNLKGYGCQGLSIVGAGMAAIELGRVDGSCSTFFLVHSFLATLTVGLLGSEEQRRELLPDMGNFRKVGCWALTEPSNGSDASALQTTARRVEGGWVLNGRKRWIGNATWADVAIIWARNSESNQVNAFIVRKGNPGYSATKMENKIALRCVQNGDIKLTDCFVPDSDRIPGVSSFNDTNKVLAISRIMVAWQPVGLALGAYDMCARYLQQRRQFGAPLASFQLMQEKLQRMLANIQAMWLMAYRLSKLYEAGKMTHEQASLVKAWNTLRGREVVSLGRELLGGNGILSDFLVAKAFADMEAYYSYEGTYEVNALVAGRGVTGISAIKPPRAGKVQVQA